MNAPWSAARLGNPKRRRRLNPNRPLSHLMAQVLGTVRDNRDCSAAEVARHLHLDEPVVRGALSRLEGRGFLGRVYTGHSGRIEYVITHDGEAAYLRAFGDDDSEDANSQPETHA